MNAQRITYGPWTIHYDPPPIPDRNHDWCFIHENYDASYEGEEDGYVSNGLAGTAESVEACKREIADMEEDSGLPSTAALIAALVAGTVASYAHCRAEVHDGNTPGCSCREIAGRVMARRLEAVDA